MYQSLHELFFFHLDVCDVQWQSTTNALIILAFSLSLFTFIIALIALVAFLWGKRQVKYSLHSQSLKSGVIELTKTEDEELDDTKIKVK